MELPRYHRLRSSYYRLEGWRCLQCKAVSVHPTSRCASCGADALTTFELSGRGELISWTRIRQPARGFDGGAGLLLGLVALDEGCRVTAQLTDVEPGAARTGMPLEMVTRRLRAGRSEGLIVYGYKFRPRLLS